jgi:hypothetical protein
MFTNELGIYPYIAFVLWLVGINVLVSQLIYELNKRFRKRGGE